MTRDNSIDNEINNETQIIGTASCDLWSSGYGMKIAKTSLYKNELKKSLEIRLEPRRGK